MALLSLEVQLTGPGPRGLKQHSPAGTNLPKRVQTPRMRDNVTAVIRVVKARGKLGRS